MSGANTARSLAALAVMFALLAGLPACSADGRDPYGPDGAVPTTTADDADPVPAEPTAGQWRTWVLSSPSEIEVPPPPARGSAEAKADLAKVRGLVDKRSTSVRQAISRWKSHPLPTSAWTAKAFDLAAHAPANPPRAARAYALLHAAMYDAVVASWHWKYTYDVPAPTGTHNLLPIGPDPSYPSEHAAIAGAASRVLAHLYPTEPPQALEAMAEEAADVRVQGGTNTTRDVRAGLDLGRAVANKAIARAEADGAGQLWDGARPSGIGTGPQFWQPPLGSSSPPLEPMAGTWKPWALTSGAQFRPGPPPAFGSPAFRAAAQELVSFSGRLDSQQQATAQLKAGGDGSPLPAGLIIEVVSDDLVRAARPDGEGTRLTTPRIARALALVSVAMADAGVAAWDAKYTYWSPRPDRAIEALGLAPAWQPAVPTPSSPSYPSGSAAFAGAAEVVLAYLFPELAEESRRRAEEQAQSRLWAGVNFAFDKVGLETGRSVGGLVVERARSDGAEG